MIAYVENSARPETWARDTGYAMEYTTQIVRNIHAVNGRGYTTPGTP